MKKKEKSNFFTDVKKTWRFMKDCKFSVLCYSLVSIIEAVISAILPIVEAKVILNITDKVMDQLILSALGVLIISCILYLMFFFKGFFYQKIYQKTLVNLQVVIARETLKIEISEMDKSSSGLFIDRLNRDTAEIAEMFMVYTYWTTSVITNIGVMVTIFILNKYLFVYAIITSLVSFYIYKVRINKSTKMRKELKEISEKKTSITSELVRGIRDIKVLNAKNAILDQTTSKIVESSNKEIKIYNISRIYDYLDNNFRALSDFIFIIIGLLLYNNKLLTIPVFIIIYNYQSKIKNLLTGLGYILEYNKKFVVAADRIFEVIDDTKFKKEVFGNKKVKRLNGNIEFKNVCFGYNEDNKIINNMNFEIKPNERVAFVGKSGAGKSTVLSLITKLYNVNSGEILLDGYNINDLTCDSIRNNMSIITQNPYIFDFSIKENLLLAKPNASMKEIREACKLACIDDFIMSLDNQYDTMIGENGIILSGGQRQRLAIARALLMKTEIILFDEATSALDNETQSEIQDAIDNLKGEYTILIVAHRLSTVIDSDKIFIVDNGKIIDTGTHKELLKKSEFYRNLYEKEL